MNTQDIELLETLLDGELDAPALAQLQKRLDAEADLAQLYSQLKEERQLRKETFAALAPSDQQADQIAKIACSVARRSALRKRSLAGMFRLVGAVAACVLVGFGVGWVSHGKYQKPTIIQQQEPTTYIVRILDNNGDMISEVKFPSSDQASQFIEDLNNWQTQQAQLRSGYVVVRSGVF